MEDARERPLVYAEEDRRFWKLILFSALTFGIYGIVFMWKLIKDLNLVCGRQEADDSRQSPNYALVILYSIITLFVYAFYWWYKQGNRMKEASEGYGIYIKEKGSTYLLWMTLGSFIVIGPFYGIYLFINNLNKLVRLYNYQICNNLEPDGKKYPTKAEDKNAGGNPEDQVGSLVCIRGYYAGQTIELRPVEDYPEDKIVIGRNGKVCQLPIPDPNVSKVHCTVWFSKKENTFFVMDNQSSFGTYLNGSMKLVPFEEVRVPLGSRITLAAGNNEFQLK